MIKLTKKIGDKEVELDIISLGGKAVVRKGNFEELKKAGITKKALSEAGFGISDIVEAKK